MPSQDQKEVLSDPNKNLSASDIRLGKGKTVKRLTRTEKYHDKILLGDLHQDKEFLRSYNSLFNTKLQAMHNFKVCLQTG